MSIIMATGCPYSGWDNVLPVLKQMGLSSDDRFSAWYDELYKNEGITDFLGNATAIQPDDNLIAKLEDVLSKAENMPLLNADSRGVWLLDFWAGSRPTTKFLLFYTQPEKALAHAIQQDLDPGLFIDLWRITHAELIRFQRSHRDRSVLVDVEAVINHPQSFSEMIKIIGISSSVETLSASFPEEDLGVEILLAKQFLVDQPMIVSMQSELEAIAQPLGELIKEAKPNLTAMIRGYQKWQGQKEEVTILEDKLHRLEEENKDHKQENEMLLMQLLQVQEELEFYFLKIQEVEAGNALGVKRSSGSKELVKIDKSRFMRRHKVAAVVSVISRLLGLNSKARKVEDKMVNLLKTSSFFDEDWYLSQYPDVAESGLDPVVHYLRLGADEGRNPSSSFDTVSYLETNPDVRAAGMNPLVHYLRYGFKEGRDC